MTLKAEKFEEMLSLELTRELEPQRGKALAAFRAELIREQESPVIAGAIKPSWDKKRWLGGDKQVSRREMWFWASVPSLVAACVAVVVTLKVVGPGGKAAAGGGENVAAAGMGGATIVVPNVPQVNQVEVTRMAVGDVILAGDKPVQEVREQKTRQTQWYDPIDKASYRVTEQPAEKVGFVEIKPF